VDRVQDEVVEGAPHLIGIEVCVASITGAFELDLLCRGEIGMRCDARVEKGVEPHAFATRLVCSVTLNSRRRSASSRSICPRINDNASLFRSAGPRPKVGSAQRTMFIAVLRGRIATQAKRDNGMSGVLTESQMYDRQGTPDQTLGARSRS
jgi:hypothetical protein